MLSTVCFACYSLLAENVSDVTQDKRHNTANSSTFEIIAPGNHAYNSHRNIKRDIVVYSHIHHRFSSKVILLGCVISENCPLLRRNFWHRVIYKTFKILMTGLLTDLLHPK